MQFFIMFIFGAVILGAGAMFAPAWRTSQPRIGLSAALAVALVVGGAVFWASLFGWDTLVVDYLLFALMSAVVLGGTLSQAQERAEARGEELADADQGWTGPEDLALFGVLALLVMVPLGALHLPLSQDAPTAGLLAVTAGRGGSFDTLAPFHPEVDVLFSPGFSALTAYLSQQLNQPISLIQMAVGAVLTFVCLWLIYDLGSEWRDKNLGRAMLAAMLLSGGVFGVYLNGHYTILLGLLFSLAFCLYALRYLRHHSWLDLIAAGLMLGAVIYANPTMMLIIGGGFIAWIIAALFTPEDDDSPRQLLPFISGIPTVALIGTAPWLLDNLDLIGRGIASPYGRDISHLWVMVGYHGIWIVPLAIFGAWVGWRDTATRRLVIAALVWWLFIIDLSVIGISAILIPPLNQIAYPFSIAWHGVLIPYAILGGVGVAWLWEHGIVDALRDRLQKRVYLILGGAAILLAVLLALPSTASNIITALTGRSAPHTTDDIAAMRWVAENTPPDSRLLNPPDALWAAAITQRDAVYLPLQPYFDGTENLIAEGERLRLFWNDPTDASNADIFIEAGIHYILVTESQAGQVPLIDELSYLNQIFEQNGAMVYEVQLPQTNP